MSYVCILKAPGKDSSQRLSSTEKYVLSALRCIETSVKLLVVVLDL
jgi:hypothetical protein